MSRDKYRKKTKVQVLREKVEICIGIVNGLWTHKNVNKKKVNKKQKSKNNKRILIIKIWKTNKKIKNRKKWTAKFAINETLPRNQGLYFENTNETSKFFELSRVNIENYLRKIMQIKRLQRAKRQSSNKFRLIK